MKNTFLRLGALALLVSALGSCGDGTNSTTTTTTDSIKVAAPATLSPKDSSNKHGAKGLKFADNDCMDDLDLSGNFQKEGFMNKQLADFSTNFKHTSDNLDWQPASLSLSIPLSELMKLKNNLTAPDCADPVGSTHYITGLKVWLGADDQNNLTLLFQPMVMLRDKAETIKGVSYYNYVYQEPPNGTFYKWDAANAKMASVSPEKDTSTYYKNLWSKKHYSGSAWGGFIYGEDFDADTKFAVFPFQEILEACGDVQGNVIFSHAAIVYNINGTWWQHYTTRSRWKHHLFVSGEGGKHVTDANKFADVTELGPPNTRSGIYKIK